MNLVYKIISLIAATSFSGLAMAEFGDPKPSEPSNPDPLVASAHLRPETVEAGGTTNLTIDLSLDAGYHAYLERFRLLTDGPDDLKLDEFKIKPTVSFNDKISKSMKQGVVGKAKLSTVLEVPKGFKPGSYRVKLRLTYQACKEEFCLFPKTQNLEAPLIVK